MSDLFRLLSPRFLGIRNSIVCAAPGAGKRTAVMISVGLAFWIMMFIISSRVLIYFKSVEVGGITSRHDIIQLEKKRAKRIALTSLARRALPRKAYERLRGLKKRTNEAVIEKWEQCFSLADFRFDFSIPDKEVLDIVAIVKS